MLVIFCRSRKSGVTYKLKIKCIFISFSGCHVPIHKKWLVARLSFYADALGYIFPRVTKIAFYDALWFLYTVGVSAEELPVI